MCKLVSRVGFLVLAIVLIIIYILQWGVAAEIKELFRLPLS